MIDFFSGIVLGAMFGAGAVIFGVRRYLERDGRFGEVLRYLIFTTKE